MRTYITPPPVRPYAVAAVSYTMLSGHRRRVTTCGDAG